MTRRWLVGLMVIAGLTAGLTACGKSSEKKATTKAAAHRKALDAPHFSQAGVRGAVMLLPAAKRRAALLRALNESVLLDARFRVHKHQIEGPVKRVSCAITRDDRGYARKHPHAPVLRYDCLAVRYRSNTSPPMELGTQFEARVNFGLERYAWCLFTPVGGEGAHNSETFDVVPSPECVAPPS